VVGGAATVLSGRRAAALAAVGAVLVAWNAGAGALPNVGLWPDALLVALVLFPLTFSIPLIALPAATARGLLPIALALGALSVLLHLAGLESLFNVTKLLALTAAGFWFMHLFEELSWVVLIALIIPWIDAISVWRGPTEYVVSQQPGTFERVSIAFRLPGETGSANIGPPDILFFALFLSAAQRYGLRVWWTWLGMVGLLAATLIVTTLWDASGLPALPAIALGFLLPNVDLIWRGWRANRAAVRENA
jgi:hypothetical protein